MDGGSLAGVHPCASAFIFASPRRVLRLVILQVLPALDGPPPVFVLAVPLDRRLDRLLEPVLRLPAELALDLARVDRVPAVVAGAVLYVLHALVPALAHLLQDHLRDPAIGDLVVAADVVDLAGLALVQNRPHRVAVVL